MDVLANSSHSSAYFAPRRAAGGQLAALVASASAAVAASSASAPLSSAQALALLGRPAEPGRGTTLDTAA